MRRRGSREARGRGGRCRLRWRSGRILGEEGVSACAVRGGVWGRRKSAGEVLGCKSWCQQYRSVPGREESRAFSTERTGSTGLGASLAWHAVGDGTGSPPRGPPQNASSSEAQEKERFLLLAQQATVSARRLGQARSLERGSPALHSPSRLQGSPTLPRVSRSPPALQLVTTPSTRGRQAQTS